MYVLNSEYIVKKNAIYIRIGLDPKKNYLPIVDLAKESIFGHAYFSGEEMSKLYTIFKYFEVTRSIAEIEGQTQLDEGTAENPIYEVGDFTIQYNINDQNVLIRSCSGFLFLNLAYHEWCHIFTLFDVIIYKVKSLEKYSSYASITHMRLVQYYSKIFKSRKLCENFLDLDAYTFQNSLLKTPQNTLPPRPPDFTFKNMDIEICELIDAEIRMYSSEIIFKDICSILHTKMLNDSAI